MKRFVYLDIVRIVACVLVVVMHAPMQGASGALQNINYTIASPCIGLFFMVSGALLLPTDKGWDFLGKRFSKVLFPALFWTLFYIAANIFIKHQELSLLPKQLLSVPFSPQGYTTMWFIYPLIGLYLLTPLISPYLKTATKKDIQILLFIWAITLLFPFLTPFLEIKENTEAPLYYFAGYVGYFILGYYFKQYNPQLSWFKIFAIAALALCGLMAVRFFNIGIEFTSSISYLSLLVVMLTVSVFATICKLFKNTSFSPKTTAVLEKLSNLTFGVYLVHIFFIRYLFFNFMEGGLLQILITIVGALLLSYSFCYLLSFFPFAKYIIGYTSYKRC